VLSDAEGARVLLVDDDPEVRRTLAEIMRSEGLVVETASNGPAGLRAAANRRPDLILLDIVMPGLNGGAVAQRLRADERTRVIPLIAVTGVTEWLQDHGDTSELFAAVLFKPVNATQLMDTISQVLRIKGPDV
jgi:CheY-like chemotaxis protein